eukprot:SAG31_NODE_41114_length_277_cov_1.207865_1_plen_28_part_01
MVLTGAARLVFKFSKGTKFRSIYSCVHK